MPSDVNRRLTFKTCIHLTHEPYNSRRALIPASGWRIRLIRLIGKANQANQNIYEQICVMSVAYLMDLRVVRTPVKT